MAGSTKTQTKKEHSSAKLMGPSSDSTSKLKVYQKGGFKKGRKMVYIT